MADVIRLGIAGAGWPGATIARAAQNVAGIKVTAVADLIPDRRRKLLAETGATEELADASELTTHANIDAIVIALPNHLHAPIAIAAMKAGKHVLCEAPMGISLKEARQIESASKKSGKTFLLGLQRRFGPGEQAARQAIAKGYAGDVYHARASWLRTRGQPVGTGWYIDRTKSGGGVAIDLGLHILDIAWHLMGEPAPTTVFATTQRRFIGHVPAGSKSSTAVANDKAVDVEDACCAVIRLEGGRTLELSSAWSINQPASQNGTVCRLYGTDGAVEVYTPRGAILYRSFSATGAAKEAELKPPKVVHHVAMLKHFRNCVIGKEQPMCSAASGVILMSMIDAIYKSDASGKSVTL